MATTENQPPEQQSTGSHSERLLKAQAAELAALRERVADLPDVDTIAAWRASHERLSQLQADLPGWRAQLQQAHQAERQQLQQTVAEQQQALAQAQLRSDLQAAFLQAGGSAQHFPAWMELAGKHVTRGEDGALVSGDNGGPVPLADALARQRDDSLYGVFFHPRYGSGAGARSGVDGRVTTTRNLQGMSTGALFREAFVKRGAQQ